jgi:hypothetical protein
VTTDRLDEIAVRIAEQSEPDPKTVELIRQRLLAAAAAEGDSHNEAVAARACRRQRGPWAHRVMVVAVAAIILAVFFVPLPHLS